MKPRLLRVWVAVVMVSVPVPAWATWSVLAVDRSTGRVVLGSASCVNTNNEFMKQALAVVVPGKGVAACQAASDMTHQNQMLVFTELQKGTDPQRIIDLLSADPNFQSRQFGILDLEGRSAGHTGLSNGYVAQHMSGRVPDTEIFYSIQANTMRAGAVVPNAVQAFIRAGGAITDRVMAAMEAADGSGGDNRCTCPPWPTDGTTPAIPCDGRTAHVALILMAEPTDAIGTSHHDGKYALYITVAQPGPTNGPQQIKVGENLNPIKTLRLRYDVWRKAQAAAFR